jgi:hypothetical protein
MNITIHASFVPHDDPDASRTFCRDTLGFVVRNDVGHDGMRWITVGPVDQPGTSIVLHAPAADPGGIFERVRADGVEVVQEPRLSRPEEVLRNG